jgi:hypothetical protein
MCRNELEELGRFRKTLGAWAPPSDTLVIGRNLVDVPAPRKWWQDVPAWAKAAAAVLLLTAGAGLAGLEVRMDNGALLIRSGWFGAGTRTVETGTANGSAAPWRADLAALERQLEDVRRAAAAAPAVVTQGVRGARTEDEVLREMRALVAASERRQQRELALRVGEALRDVQSQRQADLVRIDRTLGLIQNDTGAEVLRQRRMLNDLAVRVSQRP